MTTCVGAVPPSFGKCFVADTNGQIDGRSKADHEILIARICTQLQLFVGEIEVFARYRLCEWKMIFDLVLQEFAELPTVTAI